jgi:hypothetical protein
MVAGWGSHTGRSGLNVKLVGLRIKNWIPLDPGQEPVSEFCEADEDLNMVSAPVYRGTIYPTHLSEV